MSVEEIAKIVSNYGVSFMITIMVLYFLFKFANVYYIKFERKMINNHSRELKEKRPEAIEKNNLIHQLLYKAMYEFKCDRVYIFEYHNGGHNISGLDFLKASNTYEVVRNKVPSQQISLQNLPVGVFAFWNMRVLNGQSICKNIDEIKKEDLGAFQVLKQQGVKSIYVIGLYDAKGYPIGFFGLDYLKSEMPCFTDQQKMDLEKLSYQISGVLY